MADAPNAWRATALAFELRAMRVEYVIRLLVAAGHVSQEKVDEAFSIAKNYAHASIGDTPAPQSTEGGVRLLTREEAEDAYANVPWLNDGASSPDWMDRINAVQRKLLEVNGLPAPKDGVPVTGHQSYPGQTPLVSGDSEANKEKG